MSNTEYYQLYGYGASGPWLPRRFKPDDTYASRSSFAQELATKLYSADYLRSPYSEKDVELILGILPSGASYLYLERTQMQTFANVHRLWPGIPASRFESLSPVLFDSPKALASKLTKYEQKKRKNASKKGDRDNSTLNSDFTWDGEPQGPARARFELQRLLYPVWAHPLAFPYSTFSLDPKMWRQRRLRVISLLFLVWDKTLSAQDTPKPLELGMVEFSRRERGGVRPGVTTYLALKTGLRNASPTAPYTEKGEKEELPQAQFDMRVHELVGAAISSPTQTWEDGVASLLAPARILPSFNNYSRVKSRDSRSRSRSPPRRGSASDNKPRKRDYSPPQERKPSLPLTQAIPPDASSVHLVDIAELYNKLFRSNTIDPKYAFHVEMKKQAKRLEIGVQDGFCAGNDCHTLALMWMNMARGNAIDDQYEDRDKGAAELAPKAEQSAPPQLAPPEEGSDDEDYDPNIIPVGRPSFAPERHPMELDSDDDEGY